MKAIVLAAGTGSRLRPYTTEIPKCLVNLKGKPLLEYQLSALQECGIDDIVVVTGHKSDCLKPYNLTTYHNPRFESTNMVYSLMCAEPEFNSDVVVCYGDIIFETHVLQRLIREPADATLIVDKGWETLWKLRMDDPLLDAESLVLDESGYVVELGKKPRCSSDIQGQYTGLFKLGADSLTKACAFYQALDRQALYDGKSFEKMYMTSFLQALIDAGVLKIMSVPIYHGWLEVDSVSDLELYEAFPVQHELFKFEALADVGCD